MNITTLASVKQALNPSNIPQGSPNSPRFTQLSMRLCPTPNRIERAEVLYSHARPVCPLPPPVCVIIGVASAVAADAELKKLITLV
jgi:hypothetical protein